MKNLTLNNHAAAAPAVSQEEVQQEVLTYQENIRTAMAALQEVEQVLGKEVYGRILNMSAKHVLAKLGVEGYTSPLLFSILPAMIKDKITAAVPWVQMGIETQLIPLQLLKGLADDPDASIQFCNQIKGMIYVRNSTN